MGVGAGLYMCDVVKYHLLMSSCYIMKLCSRLFVLYCRDYLKDDKFRYLIAIFEEVRGGVQLYITLADGSLQSPYDFVFVVIELFSLALTIETLQGKICQDSLLSGGGRSLRAKISGESVVPVEYF